MLKKEEQDRFINLQRLKTAHQFNLLVGKKKCKMSVFCFILFSDFMICYSEHEKSKTKLLLKENTNNHLATLT